MTTTTPALSAKEATTSWPEYTSAIQLHLDRAESLLDDNPAQALAISMSVMKSISESLQQVGQSST